MAKDYKDRIVTDRMNFLLDQSVDARLVAWLTARGHDTKRIGRDYPHGLPDREVLTIAQRERRILITDVGGSCMGTACVPRPSARNAGRP
jgi:hypothetical protein